MRRNSFVASRVRAQVLNEDMDEETLREIFKECLRDAPANVAKDGGPGGLRGTLAKLFRRGPRVGSGGVEATEQDISLVRAGAGLMMMVSSVSEIQ